MNSPDKKNMDKYFKGQIDSNLDRELGIFDEIMVMMTTAILPKRHKDINVDNYSSIMFKNWDSFSEIMPSLREVKWNFMKIKKYMDIAIDKGYSEEGLSQAELKVRNKCITSILWFSDVLAYSAGLIKEEMRTKRMLGLDE
tara:strand:- start:850 stop:1272 length:423 start_codon:yes stop_codon:yes gene_type:complete